MTTKLIEKTDIVKMSHLGVTIFEEYCKTEILPLKDLLKRKFHRLQKLRKQNPNDLTREETYLENEVHTMFQAVTALDGLQQVYSEHYFQLWEEYQRLKKFADYHFLRANDRSDCWMQSITELDEAKTLLSFLTEEERSELEKRRDDAQFSKLLKTLDICQTSI